MKILIRVYSLCVVGVLVLVMLLQLVAISVHYNELKTISSLAMKQTQLLMGEQIADEYYGINTARYHIAGNEEYLNLYEENLQLLKTSDAIYTINPLYVDYETGLMAIEVECHYKKLLGGEKVLKEKLLNIIEVTYA